MLFCCLDQFFPQLMFLFVKSSFVVVVQSLSHVWLFATPRTAVCQASLSFTTSRGSFKLMSIEFVMLSNHLVLCRPLLLLPSIFPSIRVFSNESSLCIRWQIKLCLFSNTHYFTKEVILNTLTSHVTSSTCRLLGRLSLQCQWLVQWSLWRMSFLSADFISFLFISVSPALEHGLDTVKHWNMDKHWR